MANDTTRPTYETIRSLQRELAEAREACRQAVSAMRDYPAYPEDADADKLAAARRRCEMVLSPVVKESLTTSDLAQSPASSADHFCPYHGKAWCHCKPAPAPSDVKGEEPAPFKAGEFAQHVSWRGPSYTVEKCYHEDGVSDWVLRLRGYNGLTGTALAKFYVKVGPEAAAEMNSDYDRASLTPLTDPSVLGVLVRCDGNEVGRHFWDGNLRWVKLRPASEFGVAARGEPGLKKLPEDVAGFIVNDGPRRKAKTGEWLLLDGVELDRWTHGKESYCDFQPVKFVKLDPALYGIPDGGERIKEMEAELDESRKCREANYDLYLKQQSKSDEWQGACQREQSEADRLRKAIGRASRLLAIGPSQDPDHAYFVLQAALSPSPAAASGERPFKVGDKVVKNPATWIPSDFDRWEAGVGIGEVVAVEPANQVDVRWPAGRATQQEIELLPTSAPAAESVSDLGRRIGDKLLLSQFPLKAAEIQGNAQHHSEGAKIPEGGSGSPAAESEWGDDAHSPFCDCPTCETCNALKEEREALSARLAACEERCKEFETHVGNLLRNTHTRAECPDWVHVWQLHIDNLRSLLAPKAEGGGDGEA